MKLIVIAIGEGRERRRWARRYMPVVLEIVLEDVGPRGR